jgi:flagellar motor switch protein FliG
MVEQANTHQQWDAGSWKWSTMRSGSREDKAALLMLSLGQQALERVLAHLGPDRGSRLRGLLAQVHQSPPAPELVNEAAREFGDWLHSSSKRWQRPHSPEREGHVGPTSDGRPEGVAAMKHAGPAEGAGLTTNDPDPAADHVSALRAVEPDRLAWALRGEHPRTVSMVLDCLEPDRAGTVLKRLPPELRREAFLRLGQTTSCAGELIPRIVRAVVQKSQAVPENSVEEGGQTRVKRMADLLRGLDRIDRMEMIAALEQEDGETAIRVKDRLYDFQDLLRIEDRSMQKLLAEIDSKTLTVALKGASQEITEKVMRNLSKRVRETLVSEMDLLSRVPARQIEEAQKAVVEAIQRLDQAGELVMEGS